MPRAPVCQIAAKAANETRIDRPAMPSAPKKVASAGLNSRKPKRMMMIETIEATSENSASRRAQVASAENGSE